MADREHFEQLFVSHHPLVAVHRGPPAHGGEGAGAAGVGPGAVRAGGL